MKLMVDGKNDTGHQPGYLSMSFPLTSREMEYDKVPLLPAPGVRRSETTPIVSITSLCEEVREQATPAMYMHMAMDALRCFSTAFVCLPGTPHLPKTCRQPCQPLLIGGP